MLQGLVEASCGIVIGAGVTGGVQPGTPSETQF
jgi:hypothetical protein